MRIIAYDHRGHGHSATAPLRTYTIERLGADLADPDHRRRRWQTRRGWLVVADFDRYLLGHYLNALRSGVIGTGGRLRQ